MKKSGFLYAGLHGWIDFFILFFGLKIWFTILYTLVCCKPIFQRYNLKANHNYLYFLFARCLVVNQYFKDTI